ncbi:hypothetical protein MKX03_036114 [Papaver bracteatum]|nr:hypothetical protein MKX03_036114 [Papaver bracteatum]
MEMTSFLGTTSSNSFTKPIINSNFSVSLPVNTSRRALTLTCFHSKPSSQDEDNNSMPAVHADWRSFRAKLVTRERSSKPHGKSNLTMNHKPVDERQANATNEVSWAHILQEPEQGCLLIATEKLDGSNIFKGTFSTGIILNKPSSMTISTAINTMDGPLYFSGPLDENFVLASLKKKSDDDEILVRSGFFEEVIEGLYYGTKQESLCCLDEMVKRNEVGVQDFRVFEGYCQWTNKILRDEIRTGHWKVIACSPNIFSPLNSAESKHSYGNS